MRASSYGVSMHSELLLTHATEHEKFAALYAHMRGANMLRILLLEVYVQVLTSVRWLCRQAEVAKHRELGALAQTKRLELLLAERYRRETQLSHFMRTEKSPPLHWLPAKHCEETLELLQKEQQRLESWKVITSCASCVNTQRGVQQGY